MVPDSGWLVCSSLEVTCFNFLYVMLRFRNSDPTNMFCRSGAWFLLATIFIFYFFLLLLLLSWFCAHRIQNPILLSYLIDFVATLGNGSPDGQGKGVGIALALFFCSVVQTIFNNLYFDETMTIGLQVRSTLTTAIFRKSLKLSSAARSDFSTGQIVNMISTDATRIEMLLGYLHYVWFALAQSVAIIGLLIYVIGPAALVGIGTLIITMPITGKLMGKSAVLRQEIATQTDKRVKVTNEILQGVKVMKVYAWEDAFTKKIEEIRQNEVDSVRTSSYVKAGSSTLFMIGPSLMTTLTYIVLGATQSTPVTATQVFVGIVYFNLLRLPLMLLPMTIGMMMECRGMSWPWQFQARSPLCSCV
jgi:ATP-binding cassette subfamily C (CFTR/MRP) protein 1